MTIGTPMGFDDMKEEMELIPLNDRVIIKPIEIEDKMKGGLYIPDSAREKTHEGEVIALGTGKMLDNGTKVEFKVKIGDKIIHGKYSGSEIKYNDEEYIIMREDDILVIVK